MYQDINSRVRSYIHVLHPFRSVAFQPACRMNRSHKKRASPLLDRARRRARRAASVPSSPVPTRAGPNRRPPRTPCAHWAPNALLVMQPLLAATEPFQFQGANVRRPHRISYRPRRIKYLIKARPIYLPHLSVS